MAFKKCFRDDEETMKMEEFKRWLLKKFDDNGDGKLSRDELREAIRAHGGWFSGLKSRHTLQKVDQDRNGLIDDTEMLCLVDFAHKYLNIKVIA